MKIGFKKSSILSGYNKGMLWVMGIYALCIVVIYTAYLNGVVGIEDKVYLVLTGGSVANVVVSPFYFLGSILPEIMPLILGIVLFRNYLKIFSYKATKVNIIPMSNRQKVSKLFLTYAMYYLIYMIISIIFIMLIWGSVEVDVIKMVVHYISRIGMGGVIILPLIITDMKCKKELLGKDMKVPCGVMAVVLTFMFIMFAMVLLSAYGASQKSLDGLLLFISIIEGGYILMKINEIIIE